MAASHHHENELADMSQVTPINTATKPNQETIEEIGVDDKVIQKKLDYSGISGKTSAAEIKLVRKLDICVLPLLWLMYFLNFMDRQAIANARLNHMEKDLNMHGTQYNTCISILFVGYLLGQIPSNMIITRVRPSIFLSCGMMTWALVSGLTALVKGYAGMVGVRFVLGFVEAPYFPGALYLLSSFYTKKELSLRIAIFGTGNVLASAFSGLIAAGVFARLDHVHGIAAWRWLFIINGCMTFGVALIGLFLLPNQPLTTWWLTAEEKKLAYTRILRQTTEDEGSVNVWRGLAQAVKDPKAWVFSAMMNVHVTGDSFKNFFPSVVKTLGYNTTITLVLTCPPYLSTCVCSMLLCYSSGRYNERTWHITGATLVAVVGFLIGATTTSVAPRYTAMVLFASSTAGTQNIATGWISDTLSQSPEKRAVALAMANTIGNIASVYTSYMWPASDGPRYVIGMSISAVFAAGYIGLVWLQRWLIQKENKRLLAQHPEGNIILYAY